MIARCRRVLSHGRRPVVDHYLMVRLLARPSDSFHFAPGHPAGVTWWNSRQARRRSTATVSEDHTYCVHSSLVGIKSSRPAPSTSRRHILYLFIACRKHLNAQHEYCTYSSQRRRRILCWPWCGRLIAALSVVIYPSLPGTTDSSWHLRLRLLAAQWSSVSRAAHEIRAVSLITLIETSNCSAADFFKSRFLKENHLPLPLDCNALEEMLM